MNGWCPSLCKESLPKSLAFGIVLCMFRFNVRIGRLISALQVAVDQTVLLEGAYRSITSRLSPQPLLFEWTNTILHRCISVIAVALLCIFVLACKTPITRHCQPSRYPKAKPQAPTIPRSGNWWSKNYGHLIRASLKGLQGKDWTAYRLAISIDHASPWNSDYGCHEYLELLPPPPPPSPVHDEMAEIAYEVYKAEDQGRKNNK